jgi:quercetin dioxygenase-like cupin family protein
MSPRFDRHRPPEIGAELLNLLPEQGSFELQHDQPGKTHAWHHHSLDEELLILSGDALLFWDDPTTGYQERHCPSGTWITLPAGIVHGSTAGAGGAVYMIRPTDGRTAKTVFLDPAEHPHPTPPPARTRR